MPIHLSQSRYRRMAWANGGGETAEVARFPHGESVAGFDWRISIATIAADGPFSTLPGIDRLFMPLEGNGVWLRIGGSEPKRMATGDDPIAFAGEEACDCALIDGPVRDLNLMTRRGICTGNIERIQGPGTLAFPDALDTLLVLAEANAVLRAGGNDYPLARLDALLFDAADRGVELDLPDAPLIAIRITRPEGNSGR